MEKGKIIIISAPSGCGKSTIISAIMNKGCIDMQFSVSATNRGPRPGEKHGVNYYFLSDAEFQEAIASDAFVEYEEVYPGRYYGTLKSEVGRIMGEGHNVILDIDVKGGVNVKEMYGPEAISIFVAPPSIQTLRDRLEGRGTEEPEAVEQRLARAEYELSFAGRFDHVVVNDTLPEAVAEVESLIMDFTSR
ncbi:MAG: guanylate kinase [Duncaniella sp.]|nr:guanylate kinase [Duncaniella sp.]MDE6178208.1 guanylate kinase [Duncaniella sp.]